MIVLVAFTSAAQAQTTSWTGGAGDSNFTTGANWSGGVAPGPSIAATIDSTGTIININLSSSDAVGSLNTTGSGTVSLNLNGNTLTLNPTGTLFYQPALFVNDGSTFSLSGTTGSLVNVTAGQIFVGDTTGNGTLNIGTSLNFDTSDSGNVYSYMVIGRNDDTNYNVSPVSPTIGHGVVNQTAGTVTTGGSFIIGVDSGTGTYNLSGGTLTTGSVGTFFPIYIGLNQTSNATSPTTGTLSITGTSTFNVGTGGGIFVGTALGDTTQGYSATVGGTGSIIQNGAGTSVTIGGYGAIFGDFDPGSTPGTGGTGTYELDAGTLDVTGDSFSFGYATGGQGYLIQTGGTLTTSTNAVFGASGSGTYNLSGGTATFNNGITLAANAGSVGVINLSGTAVLQVGGSNGIAIGSGTAVLNGSGGTIQAISDLTTSVPINLASNTRTTVDTGTFTVTLNGTVTDANNGTNGGLTKLGSGNLELTGSNNSISSFYVTTGTVTQSQAGSQLTSYELSVGYNTTGPNFTGSSNVANYNMSAGTLILAGGQVPSIVGSGPPPGTLSTLRIGDFNGTGTFTQTGGLVEVNGSLDIGNRGGHGVYSISGTGSITTELDLGDSLNILGRNDSRDGTGTSANLGSSSGELDISGNSLVSLATGGELVLGASGATTDASVALGSTGTIVQTGGTLLINSGAHLYLSAVGSGEYDLNGGILEVGGDGLQASYTSGGSYQFNLGGGMIQVINSSLTTNVAVTLTGSTTSIINTNGFDATFNGEINNDSLNNSQLVKIGDGNLEFNGAFNTISSFYVNGGNFNQTGTVTITAYEVGVGSGMGNTGTYTMSGGSLTFPAGPVPAIVGKPGTFASFRIGDFGGTGTFLQSGGTVTVNGALDIGNQGGHGTYELSGGSLDLESGQSALGRTSDPSSSSTGTLDISGSGQLNVDGTYEFIGSNWYPTTGTPQGSGVINQTGGTVSVANTATLYLTGFGSGTYNLDGGTLNIGGNSLVGIFGSEGGSYQFNLGGGTIQVTGSDLTTSVDASLISGTQSTIDTNGLNATFSGNITGSNGQLIKAGAGNLALTGTDSFASFAITGGNVNQSTSTLTVNELAVGTGTGATGTYTMTGGSIIFPDGTPPSFVGGSASSFRVGDFGGTGEFDQSGGDIQDNGTLDIGNRGGDGVYNLTGGILDVGLVSGPPDTTSLILGRSRIGDAATSGTLNISGTADLILEANTDFLIGGDTDNTDSGTGSGVVTQTGGTVTVNSAILLGTTTNSSGTYNLDGGVLQVGGTNGINSSFGSYQFNLGGGTLQVIGSDLTTNLNASLISGTTSTVDTNGRNAMFSGTLGGSGALAKVNSGTLILTAANNYSGGTEVKGGALIVKNTTGSATGSGALQIDTGATVGGSGRIVTTGFTINGTVQVGNGVGVDTTSNLTLANSAASSFTNATLQFNLGATSNDNNKLTVGSGAIVFDTSNVTTILLNINSMPAPGTKNEYDLIDTGLGTGSYSGLTFGGFDSEGNEIITGGLVIGANSSFGTSVDGVVTIGPENGSYLFLKGGEIGVMVVPEPNTWMMFLVGLLFLALLRLRYR